MTACEQILKSQFPQIDDQCSIYILGVLSEEAFETADDVYEAVGHFMDEVSSGDTDVSDVCQQLFDACICQNSLSTSSSTNELRQLETPFLISTHHEASIDSVWIDKKDTSLKVDKKRLEKAENKLKEKKDKRSDVVKKPKEIIMGEATASQQSNRREDRGGDEGGGGAGKSYDVRLFNFDVAFGEKQLISGADMVMSQGRRYGLIGRNGIGKTTLLKMMASRALKIPSHMSVLHVEQEVIGDDTQAIQSVLSCDHKRNALLREEREIGERQSAAKDSGAKVTDDESQRLSEVYAQLVAMEADKAPAKAAVIMSGLGFRSEHQTRPTREFSGGWRMRLALAQALFSKPDLLLLDEPTNMLDMKAVIWLEEYLQTWASTILVVSHDRSFLNSVSTDILHLHGQVILSYKGNFEDFVKVRAERQKSQQREYEAQKDVREHLQIFIDRFRYNANRASQVQSKIKQLEKLPVLKPVPKEVDVQFKFPEVEKLSAPILELDEVTFHYDPSMPIFKKVNLSPSMQSRICIVGENGAGKTTLLKVLLGELDPVSGVRHQNRSLKIGYFNQHHVEQMDLTKSSVQLLAEMYPGKNSEYYRGQLGGFGVTGDLGLRPISTLSGGQKSRVAFAIMSMANPNFLILDEPTNHLDMETIDALSRALAVFKGGVVIVSHDERLIKSVCNEVWVCGNYCVQSLSGGLDMYKQMVIAELATK